MSNGFFNDLISLQLNERHELISSQLITTVGADTSTYTYILSLEKERMRTGQVSDTVRQTQQTTQLTQ